MSALADLRADLNMIHNMMPLSDRETVLARRVMFGNIDIETEIVLDPHWWGKNAVPIVEHFIDQYGD